MTKGFEEKVCGILKEGFKYVAKEIGFEPLSYEKPPYLKAISTAKTALLALVRKEVERCLPDKSSDESYLSNSKLTQQEQDLLEHWDDGFNSCLRRVKQSIAEHFGGEK